MNRILITGVSGFLGWHLFHFLKSRNQVMGTFFRHQPQVEVSQISFLDLGEKTSVQQTCKKFSPDIIIHTAAITSPSECQKNPQLAWRTNVEGTTNIALAAADSGCRLIYTSTDRVFKGRQGNCTEEDTPDPLGYYGRTKLEGEHRLKQIAPEYLILRLPLIYGLPSPFHSPFTSWMIKAFQSQEPLMLFVDQFRSPLYVGDAGQAIAILLNQSKISGLYHLGGSERISRVNFGFKMAEIFGFNPAGIRSIRIADKPHLPPSPADVSLNSDKLFKAIGFRGRGVKEGLLALKKDLETKKK